MALFMCAIGGPVYVCYEWPCICVLWVALYMCTMGGPVYVCYGWPCICVLWVALCICAMGSPVYVCYGWPCICMLCVALYTCSLGGPVYVYGYQIWLFLRFSYYILKIFWCWFFSLFSFISSRQIVSRYRVSIIMGGNNTLVGTMHDSGS